MVTTMGIYGRIVFPRLLEWTLGSNIIERERRLALSTSEGRTLEIGFGTGLNLACYPETVTHLTAIDSEPVLQALVAKRVDESPIPVEQVNLDASERLPFADSTFDTVVSTFTLCSIADVDAALEEMKRVMNQSGRLLFLEHGRSDDQSVARWQDRLNPLQNFVGRGCNLNRPIDMLVQRAGFRIETLERYVLKDTPRLTGTMYRGVARL